MVRDWQEEDRLKSEQQSQKSDLTSTSDTKQSLSYWDKKLKN